MFPWVGYIPVVPGGRRRVYQSSTSSFGKAGPPRQHPEGGRKGTIYECGEPTIRQRPGVQFRPALLYVVALLFVISTSKVAFFFPLGPSSSAQGQTVCRPKQETAAHGRNNPEQERAELRCSREGARRRSDQESRIMRRRQRRRSHGSALWDHPRLLRRAAGLALRTCGNGGDFAVGAAWSRRRSATTPAERPESAVARQCVFVTLPAQRAKRGVDLGVLLWVGSKVFRKKTSSPQTLEQADQLGRVSRACGPMTFGPGPAVAIEMDGRAGRLALYDMDRFGRRCISGDAAPRPT